MVLVVAVEDLRRSEISALFEGAVHGGVEISIFVTTWPPAHGPVLHKHPYGEVFLIQEGEALITIAGDALRVVADHMVVVPADTSHRFENAATVPLRLLSIQPSRIVQQTDLQ